MNVQRIRVPIGFLYALVFLLLCRPEPGFLGAGMLVAALGVALRVWAAGHLEKWRRLAVHGPYQFTRNPLYFGSFVMGLGLSVASGRLLLVILFLFLFVLLYRPVMKREEQELSAQYGDEYRRYREQVRLFVPGRPARPSTTGSPGFEWSRVWANREYNAVIGFLIVGLFLYWKLPS